MTCALGPYNFEFMDQVHREIVTKYQRRRHLREPLGAAGRRLLLRALPAELQGRDRRGAAAHDRSRAIRRAAQFLEWRKARLTELWKHWDATVRAVNPEARFIPNGPPDLKTAGELAAIQFADNQARRGLTPPWANGRRAKEYRVGDGPPADRRHLQRRPRGAVSLEGLGAERAGDPAVGRRRHRQRHAAVGHEVLRRALRPPLAADGRAHLPVALRATSATCATRRRSRASRCCTPSRPTTYHPGVAPGDRADDHVLGMYHALVEARVPFELVHEAFLTPDRLDRVQAADPRRRGGAVRRAVRRDPRLRRARRQPARDVRDRRSTTSSAGGATTSASPTLRRVVRRPHRRADAELVSEPRRRSGDRQASSDPRRPRRHAAHHQRRVPDRRAADAAVPVAAHADSVVSRPADGGRLSARRRTPTRASSTCATSARSRVVYIPVGHRPHVLGRPVRRPRPAAAQRRRVGDQRAAAGRGRRARACSTSRSGASATR